MSFLNVLKLFPVLIGFYSLCDCLIEVNLKKKNIRIWILSVKHIWWPKQPSVQFQDVLKKRQLADFILLLFFPFRIDRFNDKKQTLALMDLSKHTVLNNSFRDSKMPGGPQVWLLYHNSKQIKTNPFVSKYINGILLPQL